MVARNSVHRCRKSVLTHAVMLALVLVFAMPLYGMVVTALKSEAQVQDVSSMTRLLVPDPVMLDNFGEVFKRSSFYLYFFNSCWLVLLNVAGVAVVCPLVAYGFSRFDWPGREVFFFVLLSTMMLPPQVTMAPVYLIFATLGWVNTFKPLWVPAWFGAPFYIFLLRQFFRNVPKELDEAAMIDGASSFTTFRKVLLPQIRPAIVAIVLFQVVGVWNDFMGPLIYIHSMDKMPLALGLQSFMVNHGAEWPLIFAAATMMTIPVLVLFALCQRFFVEGITMTGLKG
jgi:ABC-type glycerol-3-phosphate transport system permease component